MRAPTINLARRPFRNNTVHYTVFGACLLLLTVATIFNVNEYFVRGRELNLLRDQFDIGTQRYEGLYQEVERMKREISDVNLALLDNKSAFVNGLIMSRFFSWSTLFERLEGLIPYDVRIRSIRPSISPKEIEIQMDGMAKTAVDLYQFEASLAASEYFTSVYPVSENTRESRNEINFDLVMNYLPAGKSGRDPSPPTPTAGLPQPAPEEGGEEPGDDEAMAAAGATGDEMIEDPDSEAAEPPATPVETPTPAPATAQGAPRVSPPASDPAPASPTGQAATTGGSPAQAPGPAARQAPAGTPPATPGRDAGEAVGGAPAGAGAFMLMTNKEFIEKRGVEIFMKARGEYIPNVTQDHPDLSHAEYINRFGLEAFMKSRGALDVHRQKRRQPGPAAVDQDPAAADPNGGRP